MKINEFIHSRIFIICLVIISSILVMITGTYAWFTWSSSDNTTLTMTIGVLGDVTFDKGNAITTSLKPVFNYNEGESTTFSVTNKLTNGETANYAVYLNLTSIPSEYRSEDVKYALVKNGTKVSEGNLSGATDGKSIRIYKTDLSSVTTSYVFYLYLDASIEQPISMQGKAIVGNITVEEYVVTGLNLIEHITGLYNDNKDATLVARDGIAYRYSSSAFLMNDRQASMSVGEDAGNIRYYGANPSNYIYFNCDAYPETNCETWRIIGIVDGKVKITKTLASNMAWNSSSSNNWNTSSLKTYLNGDYYTGLKNDETRELISESTWYLGGYSSTNGLYANDIYIYERTNASNTVYSGNPFSIEANIGILYASDYAYAADLSKCTQDIYNYESSANSYGCRNNDWLLNISNNHWLITPKAGSSNNAWNINSSGWVSGGTSVNNIYGVPVVLYLDPEVLIMEDSGDGTSGKPYRINGVGIASGGNSGGSSNPGTGSEEVTSAELQLGDYISYTPVTTSYTTDTTKTGYTSTQTINPSELNLWRVLSKNDDGTVDIISEYVSSTAVYFQGKTGYLNFVGYLNELASKYETTGITIRTRHFGYDGQTLTIPDSSIFTQTTPPWSASTSDNSNEDKGGGDTLYLTDYNLVYDVLGTRVANKVGTTTASNYWMASRSYSYYGSTDWDFLGRYVSTSGSVSSDILYYYISGFYEDGDNNALRPIVTLDSGLLYEAGTEEGHWSIKT